MRKMLLAVLLLAGAARAQEHKPAPDLQPPVPATHAAMPRVMEMATQAATWLAAGVTVYRSVATRSRVELKTDLGSHGPVALVALRF